MFYVTFLPSCYGGIQNKLDFPALQSPIFLDFHFHLVLKVSENLPEVISLL